MVSRPTSERTTLPPGHGLTHIATGRSTNVASPADAADDSNSKKTVMAAADN